MVYLLRIWDETFSQACGPTGGGISVQMVQMIFLNREIHGRSRRQRADMPHLTLGYMETRAQALKHFNCDTDKAKETSLKWGRGRNVRLICRIP